MNIIILLYTREEFSRHSSVPGVAEENGMMFFFFCFGNENIRFIVYYYYIRMYCVFECRSIGLLYGNNKIQRVPNNKIHRFKEFINLVSEYVSINEIRPLSYYVIRNDSQHNNYYNYH